MTTCRRAWPGSGRPVCRSAIVSNSDGEYQRRKLAAAGLDNLLPGAVFSGDIGVSKPDPAIFRAGAAVLGLAPQAVVYVGDRWTTDAVGALSAGLSAVWVNRLGVPRPPGPELSSWPVPGARLAEVADLDPLGVELLTALVSG